MHRQAFAAKTIMHNAGWRLVKGVTDRFHALAIITVFLFMYYNGMFLPLVLRI